MHSVSETVARALTAHTARIFGVMGNGNAWFVDACQRLGHGIIPVRHEAAAVAAADAHHRVSGRIAVATTTYGPGFTNTLTALTEAAQARTPLVLVTGDAPTTGLRPHDIDQAAAAAVCGAPTFTVDADDAGQVTIGALAHALSHRIPVVLAIPHDVAALPADPAGTQVPDLPAAAEAPDLDEAAAEHILTCLTRARRPLILAGRGARHAAGELRCLASALHCDVATTAPARGTFTPTPGEEPGYRDLGVCGGFATGESARRIRKADVVLVIGAGLNTFTLHHGHALCPQAHLIQIDRGPHPTSDRVNEHHTADAGLAVQALREALHRLSAPGPEMHRGAEPDGEAVSAMGARGHSAGTSAATEGDGAVEGAASAAPGDEPGWAEFAADGHLDPRRLITHLNRILPADRLVATDGGHFLGWPATHLDLAGPDHLVLVGTAFQSIGLGFGAAVGVAAAAGERTCVLATGDGGGLMGLADAETFLRVAHRGVVIVFNDAAYGAELHQYAVNGLAEEPMLIPETDFAGIFRALGGRADVIRRLADLADFEEWLQADRTGSYLLDCRVSRNVVAPFIRGVAGT